MLISSRLETKLDNLTTRQQLAVALRVLEQYGIADGAAGHVTLREPGTNSWWCNPWNYDWASIRASDLIRLDAAVNVLEGDTPPSQFLDVHFLIYAARPEINCVIHNHPFYACLYSALEKPLLILDQASCLFFEDHVIYNEYKGLAQGADITRPMVVALGQKRTALLKTHGIVTCAEELDAAVFQAVHIERCSHLSWEASQHPSFDSAHGQMDIEVARRTRDAFRARKPPVFRLNWEGWARQVLRQSPDVLE
jgi:ribulose-5-phosphate 4-epimerase/fuculose-1-phosphate aldolase